MDTDQEAALTSPDELEMTEEDREEVEFLKQKITDIVKGKEQPPVKYENSQRGWRESVKATGNEIDFGSPT